MLSLRLFAAEPVAQQRFQTSIVPEVSQAPYYWLAQPLSNGAQLLTLFCRSCEAEPALSGGTPLVSVLRDSLGDGAAENDRVSYVWLLTYTRPNLGRRALSAVPFFYWRVGGASSVDLKDAKLKPLLDVSAPRHAVVAGVGRQILQFTTLDPIAMPVRATSRAYRTNETDHERLHLEEAVNYLRSAPASDRLGDLTQTQLDTVVARLQLRKKLLGGFVNDRGAANLGAEGGFQEERIRTRNWELLRQCADKTNLVFEPIGLAGTSEQYAVLWYRTAQPIETPTVPLGPIWKLLNIEDPSRSEPGSLKRLVFERALNADGTLLPAGETGTKTVSLTPLGVYSLNYPTQPLLLVDFRRTGHLRRHEMTQRSINEIVNGVIGVSHFTNWYYFVGADLYDFYASRHGSAMNQAARLDCYSQFRMQLALDRGIDRALRQEMLRRAESLAVNPLEAAPGRELANAAVRYAQLQLAVSEDGAVAKRIDRDRRGEIAAFESSPMKKIWGDVAHAATLGAYTRRAKPDDDNLARLDCYRRVQYDLAFLETLAAAGTPPEVANEPARIEDAVVELQAFLPNIQSSRIHIRAQRTLLRVKELSQDAALQTDCLAALESLQSRPATLTLQAAPSGGTP